MNDIQYTLQLADYYLVETSCKNENGSSVDRIVTLISSSDSGTDVEILFQTKYAKTQFVKYNFPALSISELQLIDWQLKFTSDEHVPFTRQITVPSSESTTHLAILFALNLKKERLKHMHQLEQKVFYLYASSLILDQLKKSLNEQFIMGVKDEQPLSPTMNIRRHPLSLLPQNQCQEVTLHNGHKAQKMMNLDYQLVLNDHYITETNCQFDCASEEAVQSVITCIDVGPSGAAVEIFFKKFNNQVSYVKYQLHDLTAFEFKIVELNMLYSTTRNKKDDNSVMKQFNIPGTKHTSHIKIVVVFNLSNVCEEPKVVYILLQDTIKLGYEQLIKNAEGTETCFSDIDDGEPKNSQTLSLVPNTTAQNDENLTSDAQSKIHSAPSASSARGSSVTGQIQSESSNVQSQNFISYNLLLQHSSETNLAAADDKSSRFDLKELGSEICDTVHKFFNGKLLIDLLGVCSSAIPDLTVKSDPNVTVNMFQVINNISCKIDKVTNAVIGEGTIYNQQ